MLPSAWPPARMGGSFVEEPRKKREQITLIRKMVEG
jgi:hypothetical protein